MREIADVVEEEVESGRENAFPDLMKRGAEAGVKRAKSDDSQVTVMKNLLRIVPSPSVIRLVAADADPVALEILHTATGVVKLAVQKKY